LRNLATVFPATATSTVGGDVPVVLSLQLGAAASLGTFLPAIARTYTAATTATITSTAGDATLSVAGDRLSNGPFALEQPVRINGVTPPGALKSWSGPTTAEPVTLSFEQAIGANEALRSGAYATSLTFTLTTATP
jgi:hypothetical protein